ncbi:MAG: flagellar protein FlaG [Sulfuricella sp.]|nr:flagellar protein FlaG [Gammaproteobacteria bacterium]
MSVSQINASGVSPAKAPDVPVGNRRVATEIAQAPAAPVEMPVKAVQATVSIPKAEQVKTAVEHINKFVQTMSSDLKFTVDEETGIQVVKVVDTKTKDVIRQIPSEEILAIAQALDKLQGLIIHQKA